MYPSIPSPVVKPAVDPQRDALKRLFNSVAGVDMEVDWMELKRILDHSLKDGKYQRVVAIPITSLSIYLYTCTVELSYVTKLFFNFW